MSPLDTTVTVRDIWHLALPAGAVLAGGSTGLDKKVEWVTSLRAAFPLFGSMSRGYLAIARLDLARGLDPRITPAYLLAELHRVGAAALVVDEALSPADATLADTLALPTFCLPAGSDLHEVERIALRTIIDREGQEARRENEIRQQLLKTFEQSGLEPLLKQAAEAVSGSLALYDADQALITRSGSDANAAAPFQEEIQIIVAGRTLGHLRVRTRDTEPGYLARIYARQAADICGIALVELAARRQAEERFGTELIEQLLDDTCDEKTIQARLARYRFASEDARYVVLALTGSGLHLSRESEETAHTALTLAERDGAQSLITHYHNHAILLLAARPETPERRIRKWVQDARQSPDAACQIGVSRFGEGIPGLRGAVRQAIDALELGQRIRPSDCLYYYEEMGLYRLLAGLRGSSEMTRFYQETLGALVDYDSRHKTDLVLTLVTFFEQGANASQASRALYIHRNTLNYRLQRIIEITGLDLADPEARLAFQIALKLRQFPV